MTELLRNLSTRVCSRRVLFAVATLPTVLLSTSASTRAEEGNKAAQDLANALAPVTCSNTLQVAHLYETYEKSLGSGKPSIALVAKAAERLAVCLPATVSNATKACLADCANNKVIVAFLGPGNTTPRDFVQAIHSLTFFVREAGREVSSDVQALSAKFNVVRASVLLEQRAFATKRTFVSESDEKRYQELRQKPGPSLTEEERALIERTRGWDESL